MKIVKIISSIAVILAIFVGVIFLVLPSGKIEKLREPIVAESSFESKNNYYQLVDKDKNVLLEQIDIHGKFFDGVTYIKNKDNEYAIINSNGDFIVNYGEYDYISQVSDFGGNYYGFFRAKNLKNHNDVILKSDGNVIYADSKDIDIRLYDNFVKFITEDRIEFFNNFGDKFASFERITEDHEEDLKVLQYIDKYLPIYYNGKTYVYNLVSLNQIFKPFEGRFFINDSENKNYTVKFAFIEYDVEEEYFILFGWPEIDNKEITKTYFVKNGKIEFEIDNALDSVISNDTVRCLVKNNRTFEYYDFEGNKIIND